MHVDIGNPAATSAPMDLPRFCTECVPDFAPLGGSRPDWAVLACAAMSVYEGGLPEGVIIPPDVLDTGLAALCAPVVITDLGTLQDRERHLHYTAVPLRQQVLCVAMSMIALYEAPATPPVPGIANFRALSAQYLNILTLCQNMMNNLSAALSCRWLTHPSGFRSADEHCQCVAVPIRLRTLDAEVHERLCEVSADTCGLSVTVQLDESVTELPGELLQFKYVDLRQTAIRRVNTPVGSTIFRRRVRAVELPATLTEIGDHILREAQVRQLDLRHTSLQRIGNYCFFNCESLTSLELPECLTAVGDRFLSNCPKLERIDLRHTAIAEIGSGFVIGCAFMQIVGTDVPVTNALKSVQLPDCVTKVKDCFAASCPQLEMIDLRNTALRRIGRCFALNCNSLTHVYLPDTVSEVGFKFLWMLDPKTHTRIAHDPPISVVCDSLTVKAAEAAVVATDFADVQ